ncbi:atrial natriuretic peptide-converting enzyme isoform X1 [Gadus morhua]|uniref:atrial natriuretic peptide-converting enzyme isoform X1 n=2 Tax=Gadus morhua TaxID=8049 RepID=UPI0011B7490B|nr:atrial natriuretic peptide-converting enzyme isoform X1 [Gadus morhua]
MSAERLEEVMFSGEPAESCPRVVFSGTASGGAEGGDIMGEACPHKLGSTNHPRLLLYILIPTISLLAALLLLILALTGIFGSGLIDSRIHSSSPYGSVADRNHLNQSLFDNDNDNFTASQGNHSNGDDATPSDSPVTGGLPLDRTTDPTPAANSASPTPATQPYTLAPDLLTSVTSLSTSWPMSTSQEADTGSCQVVLEPQCHMLPYNQTWLSSSVAVVKSSEVDMLLRFFSYLSRLSCYRHIMLFGCSLALPECSPRNQTQERRVVLPCWSFCEAAREGCEPVLQMFNASWPDFLRCSQFQNLSSSSPSPPETSCYSPRQVKGKPSVCGGHNHFLCATGICVPQKLVCNGYNDCDDWSDETHCVCVEGEFRCETGRCLSHSLVCDGYDDCGDLSDEVNCVCDPAREHRCGDGRCVSNDWLCDGDHDCVDKTDEVNCSCKSQGLLECRNGQCIPSAFRCDGDNDCKDGSDEENCHQTQTDCVPGQSSCISNPCPAQCGANSTTCLSPPTNTSCTQCEPITLELCMNLPYNSTTYPNYLGHMSQRESSVSWEASLFPALVQTGCYQYLMFYACTLLVPKCDPVSAQRIPPCRSLCRKAKERCEAVLGVVGLPWPEGSECNQFPQEGNATCLLPEDGIDECSPSHFKCRSGRCVLATKRCDGHLDCDDHSDEENCGCAERGLWECPGSKVCIQISMICDGFPDCPLLVDEVNCSLCRDNELECNNHQCVHRTLWCDGYKHCSDSSDEWHCVSLVDVSGWALTVFRTGSQYQVCADEWNPHLSQLTCSQLGLGAPSTVTMVAEQPGVAGRRRWLHVHPEWDQKEGAALQARLEKRSHSCYSRKRVSVLCAKEDCGLRPAPPPRAAPHRRKRILGGRASRPGRWPWQCSLQSGASGHICGCVLIGPKWALTVAHCFEGRESAELWQVVLGLNNLDHPGAHSQTRGVRSIIVHPRYNRAVVDYDISIIQLETEVEETEFVRPVCLPDLDQLPLPDAYCYITGWGHTGNRMPFKLQEGEVRIISLSHCQSYFDMKTITSRMLCAGFEAGTVDSCMGDSGGPLVCEEQDAAGPLGRWTLFGLTSWGSVCFSKVLGPGVYSNVTHFTPWIQRQIYLHTYLLD